MTREQREAASAARIEREQAARQEARRTGNTERRFVIDEAAANRAQAAGQARIYQEQQAAREAARADGAGPGDAERQAVIDEAAADRAEADREAEAEREAGS